MLSIRIWSTVAISGAVASTHVEIFMIKSKYRYSVHTADEHMSKNSDKKTTKKPIQGRLLHYPVSHYNTSALVVSAHALIFQFVHVADEFAFPKFPLPVFRSTLAQPANKIHQRENRLPQSTANTGIGSQSRFRFVRIKWADLSHTKEALMTFSAYSLWAK